MLWHDYFFFAGFLSSDLLPPIGAGCIYYLKPHLAHLNAVFGSGSIIQELAGGTKSGSFWVLLLFPLLITDLGLMLPFLFVVCVIFSPPPTVTEEGCWKVKAIKCRFNPVLENTISFIGKEHRFGGGREKHFGV